MNTVSRNAEPTVLTPSVRWDPLESMEFEPFLDLSAGEGFLLAHTTLGLIWTWKMFCEGCERAA